MYTLAGALTCRVVLCSLDIGCIQDDQLTYTLGSSDESKSHAATEDLAERVESDQLHKCGSEQASPAKNYEGNSPHHAANLSVDLRLHGKVAAGLGSIAL